MIKVIEKLKEKIPVIIPALLLPLIITIAAFSIDIAPVSVWSFLISAGVIYTLFAVVYGATGKIWAAWLITSVPVFLLEIINFYKLKINGAPLLLSDFSLIGGFDEIAGFALPQIKITPIILGIVGFLAICSVIILTEHIYKKQKAVRLSFLCAGLILAVVLFVPFSHKAIAQNSESKELSSQQLVIRHGIITGLYCSSVKQNDAPTMTLTQADILTDAPKQEENKSDIKPTVIFLMSESFFDVYRLPNLSYSEDPIPNFHKLKDEYSSGIFLSNTYCGGTGYVEMEFLTGLCSRYLNEGHTLDSLPDKDGYKYIPSIGDVFKNNGYSTSFIHSYNNVLYNRSFVYDAFQFDNVKFDTDFTVPIKYSGGYISDMTLIDEIIATYEKNKETDDAPSMIYAISMENHQPFLKDKYLEKSGIEIYSELSDEDTEIYETFVHGLHNADKALGKLIEYFSAVDEPVVIAFWGDHLPNLTTSSGSNIYREVGFCDDSESYNLESRDFFNMLTTDYVIWSNFELEKVDKPLGSPMFGVEVMDRIGIEKNDYFNWASNRIKDTYLVYSYAVFASADEKVYPHIPEEHKAVMNEYHQVVHDIVYGEHTLFGQQR